MFGWIMLCAHQCGCRRQGWGFKDTLHMAPFEIHCHRTLGLNHGVFNNSGAKQVESGTAFNHHLQTQATGK